jgi:hypothetical protein
MEKQQITISIETGCFPVYCSTCKAPLPLEGLSTLRGWKICEANKHIYCKTCRPYSKNIPANSTCELCEPIKYGKDTKPAYARTLNNVDLAIYAAKKYTCKICGSCFVLKDYLVHQRSKKHFSYECPCCKRVIASELELDEHKATCDKKSEYVENVLNKLEPIDAKFWTKCE